MYEELGITLLDYKTFSQKNEKTLKLGKNNVNKSYFQGVKKTYKITPVEKLQNKSSMHKKFQNFSNKLDMINYKTNYGTEYNTEQDTKIKYDRIENFFKSTENFCDITDNDPDILQEKENTPKTPLTPLKALTQNHAISKKNEDQTFTAIDYSNFISNRNETILLDK
jgi:hypothetical protein